MFTGVGWRCVQCSYSYRSMCECAQGLYLKEFKRLELFFGYAVFSAQPHPLPRAHPKTLHIPPVTKIGPHGCADDPQPPSLSNPLP